MGAREQLTSLINRIVNSYLFKQAVGALLLVLLVAAVMNTPLGLLEPARLQIERTLTKDYDFRAAFDRVREIEVAEVIAGVRDAVSRARGDEQADPLADLQPPVDGPVVSGFGWRSTGDGKQELHEGIDIAAVPGTTVYAAQAGVVVAVENDDSRGITVEVDHGSGVTTVYSMLADTLVQSGDQLQRGEPLGIVRRNEKSAVSFLHFELRLDGRAVDPAPKVFAESGS